MEQILSGAISVLVDEHLVSKVYGRRNYVIVTHGKSFWRFGFGVAKQAGWLCWKLSDIAKFDIHMWCFTYKKDCDLCAQQLKKLGYTEK